MTFPEIGCSPTTEEINELEDEIKRLKQALTKAVSLPKGELPQSDQYSTWISCGNVCVERKE